MKRKNIVIYGILAVLVSVGYALVVSGISLATGRAINTTDPIILGGVLFVFSLVFLPLRNSLNQIVERTFFRGDKVQQEQLDALDERLASALEKEDVVEILSENIHEVFRPAGLFIFLYDPFSEQYLTLPNVKASQTSDLRFSSNSTTAELLRQKQGAVIVADEFKEQKEIDTDTARLAILGCEILFPLAGTKTLIGWAAIGKSASGNELEQKHVEHVQKMCSRAANVLERMQSIQDMELRVREMNTLARIAQMVNVTLTLDDIYELIYAQTTQIVPAERFHISVLDRRQQALVEVYHVGGDERMKEFEGRKPENADLEMRIIQQQKALVTDDLGLESQKQGFSEPTTDIHAAMVVPLNTGAESIGVLFMGRTKLDEKYSVEQANLLQSIADQVAGAVVKARLLAESEERTKQLAIINDVSRKLTSTLEIEPLLQTILQNAVEILSCEAGNLLLEDEQTQDLVFRVSVGTKTDLTGQRLPTGAGVAGKTAVSRSAMIINQVDQETAWYGQPEKETGIQTRALLVVPLFVKERIVGVIEVANKKDGTPFTLDDRDLLSAFAAQAAIAMENARLYSLTDQALSERVDELSVMQRIDRELNTSLDMTRALDLTLDWAVRQTRATAGAIGPVHEGRILINAEEGFGNALNPAREVGLEIRRFVDRGSKELDAPVLLSVDNPINELINEHATIVLVPVRREKDLLAILFLKFTSRRKVNEDVLGFLERFSDHAAIAISNAQLYSAVQAANTAKSEFVSFVAHELKNPMTSIKGYTDLLAAGAVGGVNESQANFLATIRSNIDRMNTLISDLNDVTKIEAGRLRLEFKPVSVAGVTEDIVRSTRKQVEEKNLSFKIELPEDLPEVWTDRNRFTQILVNLVSNAIKYTPQGGNIELNAEACANQWDAQGAQKVVHLWVKDNGIGISSADQEKIFTKFFRSEDPKTREATGTGLGLNITRSLVEMQGGKIWFESTYRQGSTFHITVPQAE